MIKIKFNNLIIEGKHNRLEFAQAQKNAILTIKDNNKCSYPLIVLCEHNMLSM